MLERPRNGGNFLISRIIQRSLLVYSISHSSKLGKCRWVLGSSGTVVLPASSSIKSNNKPVFIQTIVPKITAIPLSSTCSMDISPSHSDGSLVSMDESMSTFDIVRSLEVEYIDDHESVAVDSIEKKA
ncbi:hypothetical protein KY290_034213 [Solanum tuberosum]|uniref:Uncharacterized protein n=1 Tax=Solanum tuberosum TaxID=4113 RepID=A0ABQ7U694_SOLTU|nr:hypothetical protein KY289_033600 [Solanum tuberosum]KAH0648251.1 hypothetical protein KY285_033499 [Solanum tuberosum]KAH0741170.1 hypothetical protein KY290_034213 [Solanum tuberosum]